VIDYIDVRWVRPKRWSDLPKFQLLNEVTVNGYVIERGFSSDGGSVPFGIRDTFNPLGKGFIAFIAHDHKAVNKLPRKKANRELLSDLKDSGVNARRAYMIYMGVEAYRIIMRVK
jgi:hypothetical protein